MLQILRGRLRREEEGFTLIELMVVVLIIAILLAIAIPTFLGAQDRARDRGAQSDLRNALTAAKTIATDDQGQVDTVTAAALGVAETSITFSATADAASTTTVEVLSSTSGSTNQVLLVKGSASGKFYAVGTDDTGAVISCSATGSGAESAVDSFTECAGLDGTTSWI